MLSQGYRTTKCISPPNFNRKTAWQKLSSSNPKTKVIDSIDNKRQIIVRRSGSQQILNLSIQVSCKTKMEIKSIRVTQENVGKKHI